MIYFEKNDLDTAIAYFKKALELNPKNFTTLNSLGCALFAQDKTDEALVYLQQAVTLNPYYRMPYCNIGYIAVTKNLIHFH